MHLLTSCMTVCQFDGIYTATYMGQMAKRSNTSCYINYLCINMEEECGNDLVSLQNGYILLIIFNNPNKAVIKQLLFLS